MIYAANGFSGKPCINNSYKCLDKKNSKISISILFPDDFILFSEHFVWPLRPPTQFDWLIHMSSNQDWLCKTSRAFYDSYSKYKH